MIQKTFLLGCVIVVSMLLASCSLLKRQTPMPVIIEPLPNHPPAAAMMPCHRPPALVSRDYRSLVMLTIELADLLAACERQRAELSEFIRRSH